MRRLYSFILALWILPVQAEDLYQIYALALNRDPVLQAAFASLQASRTALPQALAQMAPNLSANYTTAGTDTNFVPAHYNTQNYGFTLSQPIYHPEHWAQLEQARHIKKGAGASYLSAFQALMFRVASQYFAILGAIDDLQFAQAQTKSFSRQLEQSQQRFEVGLIAITDIQDAKARYDSALATQIAAENEVADQYEKLREITGNAINEIALFPTNKPLNLVAPIPNNQESWVTTANQQNLDIIASRENAAQFKAAIGAQVANHFPKVDVNGSLQRIKNPPPLAEPLQFSKSISLNVSVPLFAGGSAVFRTQEAQARYQEALKQLETQRRAIDSITRQAFRGVLTAISSVNALAQAVVSSKSALQSTQAAYEVGTRTIVDVLDAETNLYSAERDHAKARYNYLLEGLRLKQAAGILSADDLLAINALMQEKSSAHSQSN